MSPSPRRSLSLSRRRANILAVCFGVAVAMLAGSVAGAVLSCGRVIGPLIEGVPFSGVVGSLGSTHPGPQGSVTINWGDGTTSVVSVYVRFCQPGLITICSAGVFGTHTYTQAKQKVTIALQSGGGSCTDPPFRVVAAGPPPPPPPGGDVLSNPTLLLRHAELNVPVTGEIATFSDSNPSAIVADFTASIDWGDGTQSQGVVSGSDGRLSVSAPGDHAYDQTGVVTVSVSLSAPGVTTSTATGTIHTGNRRFHH